MPNAANDTRLRVLFVCAMNRWRSPTAEAMYRNDPRVAVRSAGVRQGARRPLSGSISNGHKSSWSWSGNTCGESGRRFRTCRSRLFGPSTSRTTTASWTRNFRNFCAPPWSPNSKPSSTPLQRTRTHRGDVGRALPIVGRHGHSSIAAPASFSPRYRRSHGILRPSSGTEDRPAQDAVIVLLAAAQSASGLRESEERGTGSFGEPDMRPRP